MLKSTGAARVIRVTIGEYVRGSVINVYELARSFSSAAAIARKKPSRSGRLPVAAFCCVDTDYRSSEAIEVFDVFFSVAGAAVGNIAAR